jgi:GDP-4-dehydro-6-deoxy-D-mannose reductase
MKKILVFGINGFSGKNILKYFRNVIDNKSYSIFGCDIKEDEEISRQLDVYCGDMTNGLFVRDLIAKIKPDYIINLAGSFISSSFDILFKQNVTGSKNILDAVVYSNHPVTKILLIGSAAEYGFPERNPVRETDKPLPVSPYGLTKYIQTEVASYYHRVHNVPVIIARTFNIIGQGLSEALSVGNFLLQIEKAENGTTIEVGNLDSYRDFLDIEQVVAHYWVLLTHGKSGEAYNVCSGKPTKMEEILRKLIQEAGKEINYMPQKGLLKSKDVSIIYGSNEKLRNLYEDIGRCF